MSLSQTLLNHIENIIDSFLDRISSTYNIDKCGLQQLWSQDQNKDSDVATILIREINTNDLSKEKLLMCTKPELVSLCKKHGKKCTGNKAQLISFLQGEKDTSKIPVLRKLSSRITNIVVRLNSYGNYEHVGTGLVLDSNTKKVLGKQLDDGTVSELTDDDIENCKKFKFSYDVPKDLEKDDKKEIKVEELEDEESDEESVEELENEESDEDLAEEDD